MFERKLILSLKDLLKKFPIVALLGPRQSGKTTLSKQICADKPYVNFEDLEKRAYATEDPKQFLSNYPNGAIFDEIQHVPSLFSYIQLMVDELDKNGIFLLTGSQNFILNEKISQTLAGRVAIQTLLPLSYEELDYPEDIYELILRGGYPRVHRFDLAANEFYPSYISTYIERDVRQIKNIQDLAKFSKLLKLCASHVGQVKNALYFATDLGISQNTVSDWISILNLSFVTFYLQPYFRNFKKRIIKNPKIYFYDTGLACYLLEIETVQQLKTHPLKGALFENFIIVETMKNFLNRNIQKTLYYFKDQSGREIDLVFEKGNSIHALEIKTSETVHPGFWANLKYFEGLSDNIVPYVVYGGKESYKRQNVEVCGVKNWLTHSFFARSS
ncbi:MAG: ATP-binding protein [Alphaproteobacteria bacterium]|nr:MAG: ATP-binding protein [Alphaproteobacteria bacterium]